MFGFQDFLPIFQIALTLNFAVLAYFKYSSENSKDFFVSKKIENMMKNMSYTLPYITEIKDTNHQSIVQDISNIHFKIRRIIEIAFTSVECTAIGMFFYSFFMLFYIATFKINIGDKNISSFLEINPTLVCLYLLIPFILATVILIATFIKRKLFFKSSKIIHILILTFTLFITLMISMFWYNDIIAFNNQFDYAKIIVILCILIFPFLPIVLGLFFLIYIYIIGEKDIVKKHGINWELTLNPITEPFKDRSKNNMDKITDLIDQATK